MGLSHWSSHLALEASPSGGGGRQKWTLPLYGPGWNGGSSELRDPKEPLLPAWGSKGTGELPGRCYLPAHPGKASRVSGQVRWWEGEEDGMGGALRTRGRGFEKQQVW